MPPLEKISLQPLPSVLLMECLQRVPPSELSSISVNNSLIPFESAIAAVSWKLTRTAYSMLALSVKQLKSMDFFQKKALQRVVDRYGAYPLWQLEQ